MVTIDQINKPILEELAQFDQFIADQFKADSPLLSQMLTYALSTRGKGVRPMIVMLSAAINSVTGQVTRRAWIAAMMVEMTHLASLIHDDVIDESDMRRGKPSLNAKWQSHKAVLVGDYILGRNLSLGMASGQYDLVAHISKTITTLCEGELIQDDFADQKTMTKEGYIDVIFKKTASLISVSASSGAMAAGASADKVDLMRRFGESIGMAFQIQDDILDYTPSAKTGKPSNGDLREGKITLPLLAILDKADDDQKRDLMNIFNRCQEDEEAINELQNIVVENGGIDFAREVMSAYIQKATAILAEYPDSEYRTALMNLCLYITERDI